MSTIPIDDKLVIGPDRANIDARYKASNNRPYTSVAAAEAAINLVIGNVGLTVLVADENDPDYPKAKEYWVQPKGTTPETYGLVEKGAGTTDYNDLENKPTISDGGQGSTQIPLAGNVKVTATAATSGQTTGVVVTAGQNGGINMAFTLEKGTDGVNGTNGTNGIDGKSAYQQWLDEGNTGDETDFLNSLKAQIGKFIYAGYNATAAALAIGGTTTEVLATDATDDSIVLMPNDDASIGTGNPTATMMFSVSVSDATPPVTTYTYIGDVNVDTSAFISSDKIVQDLNTGGADKVLSAEAGKILNTGRNVAKLVNKRVNSTGAAFTSGKSYLIHLKENDILLISKTSTNANTYCYFFENNPEAVNWDYSQMVLYHNISLDSTYPDTTFSVEVGKEYWALVGNGAGTTNLPSELILNNKLIFDGSDLTATVDTTVDSLPKLVEESRAKSFKIETVELVIGKLSSSGTLISSSVNAINKYPIPANCIIELNEGYVFSVETTYIFCYYDKKGSYTNNVFLRSKNTNIMQFFEKNRLIRFTVAREDGAVLTSEELSGIIKKITYVEPAKTNNFGVKQIVSDSYKNFINNVDYTDVPYTTSSVMQYAPLDRFRMPNSLPIVLEWIPYPGVNRYMVQLSDNFNSFDFKNNKYLFKSQENRVYIYNLMPNTTYYYMIGAVIGGEIFPYGTGRFNIENFPIRPIYMADVDNMRDLGGWKIGTTQRVKYGRLFRGASGNRSNNWPLVDAGRVEACVRLGITAEFDIGADGALTRSCITDRTAFKVVYCQSYPTQSITSTNFLGYPRALHYIVNRLDAVNRLNELKNDNIWFHCSGGADRTGSVAFVLNALLGVSESDLNKDYELTTFSVAENNRTRSSTNTKFAGMVAYFKSIVVPDNPNAELKDKVEYWLLSSQSLIPESENINIADDIAAFRSIMIENV